MSHSAAASSVSNLRRGALFDPGCLHRAFVGVGAAVESRYDHMTTNEQIVSAIVMQMTASVIAIA